MSNKKIYSYYFLVLPIALVVAMFLNLISVNITHAQNNNLSAQENPAGDTKPATTTPPSLEVKQEPFKLNQMEDKSIAVLQSLDKVTARTHKFEVPVGETVKFGSIYILAQACKKAPPIEQPESAAFLQIWQKNDSSDSENTSQSEWIFSGWMFASSPALSAMDHPIYDVWVLDCIDNTAKNANNKAVESNKQNTK